MGLFEKRNVQTTSKTFIDMYDYIAQTSTGVKRLTGANALKNTDIWTAVSVISSDIASCKINVLKDGAAERDINLNKLLNIKPNRLFNGHDFKFAIVANMLLNGEAIVEIRRDEAGNPTALIFLQKDKIRIISDTTTETITYEVTSQTSDDDVAPDKIRLIPQENILHFRAFTIDGLHSYSPLHALAHELSIAESSKKKYQEFIDKGNKATGILKINEGNVSTEAKINAKEQFNKALNSGTTDAIIVLDDGTDYTPINVPTDILKYINDNAALTTHKVAQVFKLPLSKFSIEYVNTSTSQENLSYLQNSLSHYMDIITAELNTKLVHELEIGSIEFVFDTTKFLSQTPSEQITYLKEAVQSSIMSLNEARYKAGLPPVDDGDDILVNMSFTPLSKLGEVQQNVVPNQLNTEAPPE